MTTLYNCHHSGDQFRITKFDDDMNPQSSYLCTTEECECPAGVRPTCRHREMLPKFLARDHIGDEWFFDYNRGGWVQMGLEWRQQEQEPSPELMKAFETLLPKQDHPEAYGIGPAITQGALEPPPGVTMIVLDHPDKVVDVHNAIADAVGEPEAKLTPKHIPRRL